MKKVYLMKGMAAMAFGVLVASCNKTDLFNAYAGQDAKQQEFTENFQKSVMNGKSIDSNQTWSTTVKSNVNVSVNLDAGEEYTLYLFADDPNLNSNAKYLGVGNVKSGASTSISIAKPADVTSLYAACVDKKGNFFVQRFAIDGTTANVAIGNVATRGSKRAATTVNGVNVNEDNYKRSKNEFISDLKNYNNNWEGYYDLTNYSASNSLSQAQYMGGDGVHFIVPANQTFSMTSTNFSGSWDATVIVVKGTLNLTKENLGDNFNWNGDGGITNQYAGLGSITHGRTIVIDGGTVNIDIPTFTISNKSNIINLNGTLNLNGSEIDYANGADLGFCNFGSIVGTNGSGINFAGGTPYYNAGNIDLTDNGYIKFNGTITFVNAGHIHANNADANAATVSDSELGRGGQNATVVNLCDMTFNKFFSVHTYIGTNNSLLYAQKGLYVNNGGRITLGSQAMIKCGDWYDNGGQVAASTSAEDYAIFQITGDVDEQTGQDTKASGYVYFDIAGTIKGKGDTDQTNYHVTNFKENMLNYTVSEATAPANITIASEEDGCNYIGYHEGDGGDGFDPSYIYYAFEDLGTTDDFDFNDVVLRVSTPNTNGESTIELVATGGTMPTYVTYSGVLANEKEVHELIGATSVTDMVNTGRGSKKDFVVVKTITGLSATTEMDKLPIGISITGNNGQLINVTRTAAEPGKAPLVVVVSGDENGKWFWPTERTKISDAYEQFGEWGANASTNGDWYKNATSGKVFTW